MACVCLWFLCAVFSLLIIQGKQDAQLLTVPEMVNVYTDDVSQDLGVWKMYVEWKDGFLNSIKPDRVTYDINIFYTEQTNKPVHNETIELKANPSGKYKWSWTSPFPLQCVSHSVQLRYREQDRTSAWTPMTILLGNDTPDITDIKIYPLNYYALVNESISFCCIQKPGNDKFSSPDFTIRITNRTYVTKPMRYAQPSPPSGFDIICGDQGSTYYIGYPPKDHNIICETRNLISVECRWTEQATISKLSTNYSINGRLCEPGYCVVDNTIDRGVMNWTLIARNNFGTTIIFDTADPKHRVHLKAPTLLSVNQLTARNATLEWKWTSLPKYSFFSMTCQVEVNGIIINETFKGKGLTSLVLADLKPFTEYKTRIQCGSREHFYKWGDWSDLITFITSEDIPEAVDVWMQVSGEHTYVVWKKASQRNGEITGYELDMKSSTDMSTERITKSPADLCHKLKAGSAETQPVISISAKNAAGVSHPSIITIPSLPPGDGVNTSVIEGINRNFHMSWEPSLRSNCGYVLDWYPTYEPHQCTVNWKKIPSDRFSAVIDSGPLSLLQRREGYVVELPPTGRVQDLKGWLEGLNIYLSWGNVSEQMQRGFIKGYNLSYISDGGDEKNVVISDPSIQKYMFSLPVETYKFTVKAFTSAGEGPGNDISVKINPLVDIYMAVGLALLIFILCIAAVFACRNRECLKSTLWPEVPQPRISAEFLKKSVYQWQVNDQLLCEESQVLKVNSLEIRPVATELQKDHREAQAFNSPHTCSEGYQSPKTEPQTLPIIEVDFSYKELPCPGIPNPTYNIILMPAADTSFVSCYMPQTLNGSL
ncbi:LIF receptor subunit alpha b isoform X2 [Tachysurus fulvidraco]|uniref:LIF receptor subunit alpha b isoform X2 n=1 Tax=Tachysurus fulvidraco TaxID=1234273 RepID=UPI001FEDB5B5|nr:LIF receptor subunit alpha b isoform X2 [Tachysurus fulvidraco]